MDRVNYTLYLDNIRQKENVASIIINIPGSDCNVQKGTGVQFLTYRVVVTTPVNAQV